MKKLVRYQCYQLPASSLEPIAQHKVIGDSFPDMAYNQLEYIIHETGAIPLPESSNLAFPSECIPFERDSFEQVIKDYKL